VYSCEDVLRELGNYIDDEVAAEVRAQLELHIAHCKTCEVLYDSARKTLKIVTESSSFEVPEAVSERLVSKVMAQVRESSSESAFDSSDAGTG